MPRLLLVRHAPSTWNDAGRWQGWADPPLSPAGERMAERAAAALAAGDGGATRPPRLGGVVASDLRRAVATAGLLAGAAGREVVTDPDLREYDAGAWTGLTRGEIERRWPGSLGHWDGGTLLRAPGGEDPYAFADRLLAALHRAAAGAEEAGGDVLVVSHGRAIHVAATALGAPAAHIANLAGWVLEVEGGRPVPLAPLALATHPHGGTAEGLPSGG